MSLRERVGNNLWLLGTCKDWRTLRAMKFDGALDVEAVRQLHFRAPESPIFYRSGTTDLSVAWEVFRLGEYECTRGWDFPTVVDCGANVGMFLAFAVMKLNGRLRRYVGVEADRSAFGMLQLQADAAGIRERSVLLQAAAWESDGEVSFDDHGPSWGRQVSAEGTVRVRAMTIDSILDAAGLEQCDLLKLDIEGGERAVLAGIRTWGPRVRALVAELHDGLDYAWFADLVESAGFQPYPPGELFRSHPGAIRRSSVAGLGRLPGSCP
ncbi:MAG TPA: FkbM family methyltransferase [Planctomycetota bacterium]|nr:FkbM family methyltransferase [Planctomycetota bacterium]